MVYYQKLTEINDIIEAARRQINDEEPQHLTVEMAVNFARNHFQNDIYESELFAYQVRNGDCRIAYDEKMPEVTTSLDEHLTEIK